MNYKISIIIPTFNIEEDIKRAIDSLLNQTIGFENLEIIIIDDCSTDNTQSIILNYCKKYKNIKPIFLKTNSGSAGKPRNIGIKYATSKYLMFLDNDDEYTPEACEIFYNNMEKTNVNMIVCSKTNNIYNPKDKNELKQKKISKNVIMKEINVLKNPDFLFNTTPYAGAMWCKIFKTKFIQQNNIQCLENLPEDLYFMHQCYYLNPNVYFITNLSLYNHYFFRVSGESITVQSNEKFLHKLFLMFNKLKILAKNFRNNSDFFNKYCDLFFNELIYKIIISPASKNEKILLMKEYYNEVNAFNPKINSIFYKIWYKLVINKKFKICYIYSQMIKLLITFKSKFKN